MQQHSLKTHSDCVYGRVVLYSVTVPRSSARLPGGEEVAVYRFALVRIQLL